MGLLDLCSCDQKEAVVVETAAAHDEALPRGIIDEAARHGRERAPQSSQSQAKVAEQSLAAAKEAPKQGPQQEAPKETPPPAKAPAAEPERQPERQPEGAASASGPRSVVEFVDERGQPVKVDFTEKRAGMSMQAREGKVVVTRVVQAAQAEKLGVKAGWVLKAVDGTQVKDLEHALGTLKTSFAKLPDGDMKRAPTTQFVNTTVEFRDETGAKREISFQSHEPGFDVELKGGGCNFSTCRVNIPRVVVKSVTPGGQAALAGVKIGWQLKAVGGVEVTDWSQAVRVMREFFENLPAAPHQQRP